MGKVVQVAVSEACSSFAPGCRAYPSPYEGTYVEVSKEAGDPPKVVPLFVELIPLQDTLHTASVRRAGKALFQTSIHRLLFRVTPAGRDTVPTLVLS